jgi:type II secretory pathway component GspD/PulD (secretin)
LKGIEVSSVLRRFSLLLLFYCAALPVSYAQQLVTEVLPLGYRSINEIIPLVRPLVRPSGSVAGLQGQLVVTATPQQMAEVRRVLGKLDKSPVRLLISVRRGNSRNGKKGSASVQGRAGNIAINNGDATVGGKGDNQHIDQDSLSLNLKSHQREVEDDITQQVQVLEGHEAYISTGEVIPVRNRGAVAGPGGVYRYDSTEFYPAVTGFYTIPRLNGDEVFLEMNTVSRKRNNLKLGGYHPQQNIAVSNINTSVTGKLGEWIVIGNIDQSGVKNYQGIAAKSRQQKSSSSSVSVRVEKIQDK